MDADADFLVELTAGVVSAYVAKQPVGREALPLLVEQVHAALGAAAGITANATNNLEETYEPAVPIRKSIRKDHLVCLACGAKLKSLKRHLSSNHDLSPQDYRRRYGLASDYPMVAPDYSAARSELAKKAGLGRRPQPKKKPAARSAAKKR